MLLTKTKIKMTEHGNIFNLENHICVGCGMCAGVCPAECISMQDNQEGGYSPVLNDNQCIHCGICKEVCPFISDNSINNVFHSANLNDDMLVGQCKSILVGHAKSNRIRENSASGGLLTSILVELFHEKKIDYAICAQKTNCTDPLFSMSICKGPEDVKRSAGSVYYPVHYEQVLKYLWSNEGKYAIVALPCVAKAIRKVVDRFPEKKSRFSYIFGLTCGAMKSKFFAEQIASKAKVDINGVTSMQFRHKRANKPSQEYEARINCSNNGIEEDIIVPYGSQLNSRHTTLKACAYCNDVFALDADAVFMDAWLDPYRMEWKGKSVVCVRDQYMPQLIDSMNETVIEVEPIELADVIKCQRSAIWQKTVLNQFRIKRQRFDLTETSVGNLRTNVLDRLYYRLDFMQACRAGLVWLKYKDIKMFKRKERFGSLPKILISLLRKVLLR